MASKRAMEKIEAMKAEIVARDPDGIAATMLRIRRHDPLAGHGVEAGYTQLMRIEYVGRRSVVTNVGERIANKDYLPVLQRLANAMEASGAKDIRHIVEV